MILINEHNKIGDILILRCHVFSLKPTLAQVSRKRLFQRIKY